MRKVITIMRKVQKFKKKKNHRNENNHNEKGPHMKKIKNCWAIKKKKEDSNKWKDTVFLNWKTHHCKKNAKDFQMTT